MLIQRENSGQLPKKFRFAYGHNLRLTQMEPPPHVPPLAVASTELAGLFERAFGRDGCKENGRPTSVDWIAALDGLGSQLVACRTNPAPQEAWNWGQRARWLLLICGSDYPV